MLVCLICAFKEDEFSVGSYVCWVLSEEFFNSYWHEHWGAILLEQIRITLFSLFIYICHGSFQVSTSVWGVLYIIGHEYCKVIGEFDCGREVFVFLSPDGVKGLIGVLVSGGICC